MINELVFSVKVFLSVLAQKNTNALKQPEKG